jgi:uncharacterized membrane protein YdjX (TVP38/TMEM64 family)
MNHILDLICLYFLIGGIVFTLAILLDGRGLQAALEEEEYTDLLPAWALSLLVLVLIVSVWPLAIIALVNGLRKR